MSAQDHWEAVYATKASNAVSWYQPRAELSLRWIAAADMPTTAAMIDVGGGASTLVDDLLALGYRNLHVLDLSAAALATSKTRLGTDATRVRWQVADITSVELPEQAFDLWHDRAVFHFLTQAPARAAYLATLQRALKPGGHVIVATFAEDGPLRCSGLPVVRYSADALTAAFGPAFECIATTREAHATPFGTLQQFTYCHLRHIDTKRV